MKIYTKTGDTGLTSLIGGQRVPKHNPRIEAYGTIDELNSHLGFIIASIANLTSTSFLTQTQSHLFTIGSILASTPNSKMKLPEITEEHIAEMEFQIDQMDAELPALQNFILPSGSKEVSAIHIGRCVCRRAERLITQIPDNENISDTVLKYINRLSDYLFILARYISKIQEIKEIPWNPNNR